jgi:hypothetical protein
MVLALAPLALAEDPPTKEKPKVEAKALEALKAMGKHLGELKAFSVEAEETIDEAPEDSDQKIHHTNVRKIVLARPSRLFATVDGDTSDVEFYFDGKSATLYHRDKKVYVVFPVAGTVEEMIDDLGKRFGTDMPLADLLFKNPHDTFLERVKTGRYVGLHRVGTHKCHHLAFTQAQIDWQIWIDAGEKPWPRKLVITYKRSAGGPGYMAILRKWNDAPEINDERFKFTPPKDAKKVEAFNPPKARDKK